jgi:hypothetical protein
VPLTHWSFWQQFHVLTLSHAFWSHLQALLLHLVPAEQAPHGAPFLPQSASAVPAWQMLPEQQPPEQVLALHGVHALL